jgi:ribosomal protein S18 acetylase RimI-like enzyme
VLATIPSWFLDPERACPATTFYRSVQVHGTLDEVTDRARKGRILQALMEKYQPEGRHVRLDTELPLYRKAIEGLLVVQVPFDAQSLTCKRKIGQNRSADERAKILEQLWMRGAPGDPRVIALMLAQFPDLPRPAFLRSTTGSALACWLDADALHEAASLLEGAYWLVDVPRASVVRTLQASTATVGARDASGRLVGFARAMSDGRTAWLYDVIVHPDMRRRGLGAELLRLLLDHPAVRNARRVRLTTLDAMTFYRREGFRNLAETPSLLPASSGRPTEMVLARASSGRDDRIAT